jgi:tetratricopeptide (TPR) repeat protein
VKGALETERRAFALAPDDPSIIMEAGWTARIIGQYDKALELEKRGVALDPVNPESHLTLAISLLYSGKYTESREEFARVAELNPSVTFARAGTGLTYIFEGRYAEAVAPAEAEEVEWPRLYVLALAYAGQKRTADSDVELNKLIKANADSAAYQVAEIYAFRGENDHAFEWLERSRRQHDPGLNQAPFDPIIGRVSADPRWPAFLHSIGMAPDQLQ